MKKWMLIESDDRGIDPVRFYDSEADAMADMWKRIKDLTGWTDEELDADLEEHYLGRDTRNYGYDEDRTGWTYHWSVQAVA